MAGGRRVRFEKQTITRILAIVDKTEAVLLGLGFAISLLVTWSSTADSRSYYHLGFCVISAGIIITAILVALSGTKLVTKQSILAISILCRAVAVCIMLFYDTSFYLVASFAISSLDRVSWLFTTAKLAVMIFTLIEVDIPVHQKVSVALLCLDFFTVITREVVFWRLKTIKHRKFV